MHRLRHVLKLPRPTLARQLSSMPLPETFIDGWHDVGAVAAMPYRPFGSGRTVSALSLGGSALAGVFHAVSLEESVAIVHTALKSGVNMIDTAPWYGNGASETILGKALVGVPRGAYYLNTKVSGPVAHSVDNCHHNCHLSMCT